MIVELIPKQEQKPIFGQVFFLIVSFAVLAGVAIAYVILQQFIETSRTNLEVLERQLTQGTRPLEQELSAKLEEHKQWVEDFLLVADKRESLLPLFRLLEETTHPGVFFVSLAKTSEGNILTGEGEAQNFIALEQQRLAWKQDERLEAVQLREIQLTDTGGGSFRVEFTLRPELLEP